MLIYILKFSACLAIFMVFYKLVLEKENMHTFKRFYLLAAIGLAIGIPLVTFIEYIEPLNTLGTFQPLFMDTVFSPEIEQIQESHVNYLPYAIWSIYGLGVLFFGIKFSLNLNRIHHKIKHNPKRKINVFTNVLLKDLISPHTFFNYIFLNKSKFESNEIPEEVFIHEQAHATQKHSIDILIIEFLQVIFWFNPLIYFTKHSIKLNHEFLADQAVLNNGVETSAYQEILLAFSSSDNYRNAQEHQLANAINYSSIKKRFTVMKTKTSKRSLWLRSLLLLPLLAIILYSFSNTVVIEKETPQELLPQEKEQNNSIIIPEKYINVRPQYVIDEASDTMMQEYKSFIEDYKKTNIIRYGKLQRATVIYYDIMSNEQRASVVKPPATFDIDLTKTKAKKFTKKQFESWKNAKEFAIWIDGKHVNNSVLNNYNNTDFVHYIGSKVYKNAQSEKFTQPFQFRLYTKKGFENTYQNYKINEYHSITKTYTDAITNYLKTNQSDNSNLRILKAQTDKIYFSFSKDEITKHNILPSPPVPAQYNVSKTQQKATPKQVAEYNRLVKHISSQPRDQPIIKLKDLERLKYLYSIMSDTQKKNAESFPNIPPAPPAPPKPKQVIEVKNIPIPNSPQNNKNKSGPNSPSNLILKSKDSVTFIYSNFSETQQKEKKVQSAMSEDQKKQLSYRMLILRASKLLDHKPTYKIEGQQSSFDDVYTFINDYPQSLVKTIQNSNKNLTLSFTNSNGKKMSYNELQAVYTKVFNMTKEPELIIEVTPAPIPENATPEERARKLKATQTYAETKAGKIIKVAKTAMDDEGIVKINGKTYYYKTKDGETTIYNKFGDVVDIKNINSFSLLKNTAANQEKEWSKVKRILQEHSTKDIIKINGKTPINNEITLTRKEVKNLKLTLKHEKVLSFNFKVPGEPTTGVYGNSLNREGKLAAQKILKGYSVQIFDIKTSDGNKHPYIFIIIKD